MKRKRLGDAACPVYTIEIEAAPDASAVDAIAFVGRSPEGLPLRVARLIGTVVGEVSAAMEDGAFRVNHSFVHKEHRRCGLGTKLYTKIAQWGCARGRNLESDEARSEYSQAFWAKQETKKRAYCVAKVPAQYRRPDLDLKPGIQNGRGGCEVYKLRCPATDLSGRTTRPRRPRRQTRR